MPSFRVLVNTPSPQSSVGITTGLQLAMTLGCGAMAGNITSNHMGSLHLINIKRIVWAIRTTHDALSVDSMPAKVSTISPDGMVAPVEGYFANRRVSVTGAFSESSIRDTVASVVDAFLDKKRAPTAATCGCSQASVMQTAATPKAAKSEAGAQTVTPPAPVVDFVRENDVLAAVAQGGKIFIDPRPSSRPAREISPHATMFWFWLGARPPETCPCNPISTH